MYHETEMMMSHRLDGSNGLKCVLCPHLQTDDGEDDLKKGTQLLEIYALEIQMYTAQKNNKKLKALYEQSLHIKSAIPHPLIMGVIRGKLVHTFL